MSNLGKRDRQITLQAPVTVAQNAFGEPAPAQWADVATEWARVDYVRPGAEVLQAAELVPLKPAVFGLRYRADVLPTWRLVFEGLIYHILDVSETGRRQGVALTAVSKCVRLAPVTTGPAATVGFPYLLPFLFRAAS